LDLLATTDAAEPGTSCKQLSWWEPRSPATPRVEGSGRTVLACPTPAASAPTNTRVGHRPAVLIHRRLRWPHRMPLWVLRHARCPPSPGFQGQGRPPGQATGGQSHGRGHRERGRREQEPSFFTVIVWRELAEHAAQSLSTGSRVVVVRRLQQRSWTAEDGTARSVVEVVAEELGPSPRWATATTTKALRDPLRQGHLRRLLSMLRACRDAHHSRRYRRG
jgi:hypothetical protein